MSTQPRIPVEPNTGASFVTFRLERQATCWHYRTTFVSRFFQRLFSLGGFIAVAIGLVQLGQSALAGMGAVAIGALFIWIGRYLSARFGSGPVFDTQSRRIEVYERLFDAFSLSPTAQTRRLSFDKVRELEILHKIVRSSEGPDYKNVELNLVLKDGERINLVSHPDGALIAREATTLGKVLNVPIGDFLQEKPA